MKTPTIILLTSDPILESVARVATALAGYGLVVGHDPQDGARLFARSFDSLYGVVVDLDSCHHGSAWLTAMTSASRKIPGSAISRLSPQLLQPLARRYGAEHWLSKPVTAEQFCAAIQILVHEYEAAANPLETGCIARKTNTLIEMPVMGSLASLAPSAEPSVLHEGTIKRRDFSAYCDGNDRCILKENGFAAAHCVGEVSDAIDFIVNLDLARRSALSVYNPDGVMFRILV